MTRGVIVALIVGAVLAGDPAPIIDSQFTRADALAGTKAPTDVQAAMVVLDVCYYAFDGRLHQGQMVVHRDVQHDVQQLFALMRAQRFPVGKCIPVVRYGWSDDASMKDNNTSAFNYRTIAGTNCLSNHAYGRALDINPRQNPAVYADGTCAPRGATYATNAPGTLTAQSALVKEAKRLGWRWGGDYVSFKDYQHFEK